MSKPTSLASQIAKAANDESAAQLREDLEVAFKPAPEGKVWVRLIRYHLDRNGVMHSPGIVALDKGFVPDSAKLLAPVPSPEVVADTPAKD
jgi:hypothetical protein